MTESQQRDWDRYVAAAHAMQSGVAMEMNINPGPTLPKHLRVGINAAMSDSAALVKLLVAKGVITDDEYYKAIADQMEEERDKYAKLLSEHFEKPITLG